jgi:hypothetical protein
MLASLLGDHLLDLWFTPPAVPESPAAGAKKLAKGGLGEVEPSPDVDDGEQTGACFSVEFVLSDQWKEAKAREGCGQQVTTMFTFTARTAKAGGHGGSPLPRR